MIKTLAAIALALLIASPGGRASADELPRSRRRAGADEP